MFRLYEAYEPLLDEAARLAEISAMSRFFRQLIAKDLGEMPESRAMSRHTECAEEIWAAAYVIEGAGMGARHIVKKVAGPLPHQFLAKLADESHHRWPRLVAALEDAGGDCDVDATIEAARNTFAVAETCFRQAADEVGISPAMDTP